MLRSTNWKTVALGLVFAAGLPLAAAAQNPNPNADTKEPYTPAKDARDLKSVLFNWMWHTGMLKGHDERDMVHTLEHQAKSGTIQVNGQPCALTKYRASLNYQTFAERIQYTCTRANGQAYSNVEVVAGLYAWDEDTPGAEIAGTKGKVTPMAAAAQERLIRLWASPQGAAKAAIMGTSDTFWLGANPGTILNDGLDKIGKTSVTWQNGNAVVTFPIPMVAGATATATLNSHFMAEKVVVTNGAATTEFTYGNYQDFNNPLNKIEVLYAGKLTEKRNGTVVRDLTTSETETGNVYVMAPVPPSVQAAEKVAAQVPKGVFAKTEPMVDMTKPTPRRADGHPDLTGNYVYTDWIGNYMTGGGRRCGPEQAQGCNRAVNQTYDFELYSPSRFGNLGHPVYKPQYWDKVQQLDMWTNKYDPVMTCMPLGVPREGPPRRIFQTDRDVTFIYTGGDAGGGYGEFRIIPTDGRPHRQEAQFDIMFLGDTVGKWDGDTLVLDAIAFTDQTWIGRGGFFHSDKMHVTEKFTRKGDALLYDVTVEDPEVLAEPWVFPTRVVRRNPNPDAGLIRERGNCEVFETEAVATQIRH